MKPLVTSLLALVLATPLVAQEPPPRPSSSAPAEARWKALSKEQRALVRERYRAWKEMAPERRRDVEERCDALHRLRDQLVRELPDDERRRLERMDVRAKKRALRPHLRRHLMTMRQDIQQRLAEDGADGADGLDKQTFRKIRRALRERAGDHLVRFEERGVLAEGEAERLLSLSPSELGGELRRLNKAVLLQDPPKELLLLSDDERERILALPPDEFFAALAERKPRGKQGRGPGRLPRSFQDAARGRSRPPRMLPRPVLEQVLSPGEMQELEAMTPPQRAERVHELLRAKARAAHVRREGSPAAWEQVEAMPRQMRERRWLKWIDPTIDARGGRGPRGERGGSRQRERNRGRSGG